MKRISLSLLFFLTTCMLHAYFPLVKNYQRETYRAGTQTWAITQIPGGTMFFANNDGVLAFNGKDWTLIRLANRSSARSLYYDAAEDCLYTGGTNELGKISFDPQQGMVYESILEGRGVSLNEIWSIGKDDRGDIWFADNSSRYTINADSLRREPYSRFKLSGKLFCSAENDEYLAEGTTGDGIWLRHKADGSRMHLTSENGLQNNSILCLFFDSSGGLWAGTDRGIDYILLEYPFYNLFGDSGNFGGGYAICKGGGYIWLGTNMGLFRVREDRLGPSLGDGEIERIQGIESQVWGLEWTGREVIACCDRGIYICKGGTATNYISTDGAWKTERLAGHPDTRLCCSYTRLFTIRRQGGTWRFGGWITGFDEAGKSFVQDSDSRIWFAHHVKGLYRLTLSEDLQTVTQVEKFGSAQGFPTDRGNYPSSFHGNVIFSTEGGFYSYDNMSGKAVAIDELNHRFAGTPNSLSVFETPMGSMRYYSSGAMQAVEYNAEEGVILDSLSLRALINHRPVGFECIESLSEQELLLNSEDGFVVLNLGRLMRLSSGKADSVYINSIANTGNGKTLYTGFRSSGESVSLRVPHKLNALSISFLAPSYDSPLPCEYSCMLKGYDKEFSPFGPENSRLYYRIPSGHYTFIVRSRNPLHGNRFTSDSMDIIIQRPWTGSLTAWILYIIGGFLLIYLALGWFDRQSNRRAKKIAAAEAEKMRQAQIRKDLQRKADDLAASTMSLQRKNELLQQIASKVDDAVESAKNGDPVDARLKRLRGISELIHENITHENDWQKFQDNFDLVYDDFLKRLGARYPELSVTDKRICAYLRMGLSSKDISPLLGMTVRSVEMTRYRIRQKIGLSRDDNLTSFIQRF